ncbi:MAG: phosphoglycerate kinase, partial [Gemmatimonadota bacterium]|nr:phosphoglycerate kinase [Gemmatimonadota bacterium]
GGMANTFLKANGVEVGDSLVEDDLLDEARALRERHGEALSLPVDAVVAREIDPDAETRKIQIDPEGGSGVEPGWKILDVGPETVERFGETVEGAGTVFWNGPLGVFETSPFDVGTRTFAERLAAATERGAYTVTGGGDSLAALERAGLVDAVSHASTGGGAALDLVSGASLPGIEALDPASSVADDETEEER